MLHSTLRDLRYAVRQLVGTPTFAIVAIVTLALGVGANTAIFSVINGLLLRPLPYPEPERLLFVDALLTRPEGTTTFQVSYPDIEDLREQATTLAGIAAWSDGFGLSLEDRDGAARIQSNFVGRGYFDLSGSAPRLGRAFTAEDHQRGAGGSLVAILSDGVWRQHFESDPSIVGREIRLQNRVFTVIGVMPASFHDPASSHGTRVAIWVPVEQAPALFAQVDLTNRGNRLMWAIARLAPGASLAAARAELAAISATIASSSPATHANFTFQAVPLAQEFFVDARQPLWMLLGGSVFVLLIGCANVANLLLVRSSARARELAVRLAIGASPSDLVRQLIVEGLVLAVAGGAAGILLALWLTPVLVRVSAIELPAFVTTAPDARVLSVALASAIACGILFSLAPIWKAMRLSVRDAVAGTGRVAHSRRGATWLAGVEISATFVLIAGALLMTQSLAALSDTDLDFRSDRLLTLRLELPQDRYATPAARAMAGSQMLDRLRALPGVEHATIWGPSMFARSTWVAFLTPVERAADPSDRLMVARHSTNPGALRDLGIAIVSGRDISAADTLDIPMVGIVSEGAARRLWPGEDAVGRQVRTGAGPAGLITIIGVAADARHRGRFRFSQGPLAFEPQLDIYMPYAQRPNALVTFGVRTRGDAEALTSAVRAAIAEQDATIPIYDVDVLDNRLRREESPVSFAALLLSLYGGLAMLLAGVGVYGVLASAVASRTRELGIRSALGANPQRLLTGVISEGLAISGIAIAVGMIATWALTQSLGSALFGVAGSTNATLAAAAALLILMSAAASAIPARRASRVDPVEALRIE